METEAVTMQHLDALRKEIRRMKRKEHPTSDNRWIVPSLITATMALLLYLLSQNNGLVKDLHESRLETGEQISGTKEQISDFKLETEKRFNDLDRKIDKLQTSIDCLRKK